MIASSLLCPPNNITDVIYNLETLATRGPLIVRQPVTVDTDATLARTHMRTYTHSRRNAVLCCDSE